MTREICAPWLFYLDLDIRCNDFRPDSQRSNEARTSRLKGKAMNIVGYSRGPTVLMGRAAFALDRGISVWRVWWRD